MKQINIYEDETVALKQMVYNEIHENNEIDFRNVSYKIPISKDKKQFKTILDNCNGNIPNAQLTAIYGTKSKIINDQVRRDQVKPLF